MRATELLKEQHRQVEQLFKRALRAEDREERQRLCGDIATSLQQHTALEEQLFYPAVREETDTRKARKLVLEAYEEHHAVDLLLKELPHADPAAESYEAKLTVLQELVDQHVDEEEGEMFPLAERVFGKERSEELAREMQRRMDAGHDGGEGRARGGEPEHERSHAR